MPSAEITIETILKSLDALAPFALAEDWDNVGLLVGALNAPVTGIMIGLDPTTSLLDEALSYGANLVITHHPVIFPSLKVIRTDQPAGAFIAKALTNTIGVIACHTNLDVAPRGVSHALAVLLGLTDAVPLSSAGSGDAGIGFGQIGFLAEPMSGSDFFAMLGKALKLPALAVAGPIPDRVSRVALCGGSGSDLAIAAQAGGAHIYITAEVKHHVARWAEEVGFCVIDAGHFVTEAPISETLAPMLMAHLASQDITIP
ncbi:MAG: Nif3-like dinuclear metal center hexameric protein, partial [Proteobacteria bacterium]|nr:Nif3-like dinuclear metal center hexameric protein [Desulfobulbaceae bacterium]MBU4151601.1 Nif3-like dinuclear metal center hexameric protein [Pseudomonadota bacterium]